MKTITLSVSDFQEGCIRDGIIEQLKDAYPNLDINNSTYFDVKIESVDAREVEQ